MHSSLGCPADRSACVVRCHCRRDDGRPGVQAAAGLGAWPAARAVGLPRAPHRQSRQCPEDESRGGKAPGDSADEPQDYAPCEGVHLSAALLGGQRRPRPHPREDARRPQDLRHGAPHPRGHPRRRLAPGPPRRPRQAQGPPARRRSQLAGRPPRRAVRSRHRETREETGHDAGRRRARGPRQDRHAPSRRGARWARRARPRRRAQARRHADLRPPPHCRRPPRGCVADLPGAARRAVPHFRRHGHAGRSRRGRPQGCRRPPAVRDPLTERAGGQAGRAAHPPDPRPGSHRRAGEAARAPASAAPGAPHRCPRSARRPGRWTRGGGARQRQG